MSHQARHLPRECDILLLSSLSLQPSFQRDEDLTKPLGEISVQWEQKRLQSTHCKSSSEAVKLGAGGPTEIYIKLSPIHVISLKWAEPINISMPSQQQNPHSLNNIVNTTCYYSYTSHLQCKFSLLHLSLASFPIVQGIEKGNKTATGAETLHIMFQHSSYNSLYFSASLHFSQS